MTAEATTSARNQIELYDSSDDVFETLYDESTVTLPIDSNGYPSYDSTQVSRVEATLDTDLTIQTTGTGLTVNDVRAEGSDSGVSSVFSWQDATGGGIDLVFTVPGTVGQWMEWEIGYNTPFAADGDGSDAEAARPAAPIQTPAAGGAGDSKGPVAPIRMPVKIVRR